VYKAISDYGIIGDLHSVALVGNDGSIDWCCLPRIDSPSVFAALLDARQGGAFRIGAQEGGRQQQMYLPDTTILITRFLSPQGVGEITDFMPLATATQRPEAARAIVRGVKAVRGRVTFVLECAPAFDYGRLRPTIDLTHRDALFIGGDQALGLTSPVPLRREGHGVRATFTLSQGDERWFVLRHGTAQQAVELLGTPEAYPQQAFDATCDYWWAWARQCTYHGRYCEMVRRSALTLKLLTFAPTGAIVAAPTTSLPEAIGGVRNWDYRYCWLRDASLTLQALFRLGYAGEGEAFWGWVRGCCHALADGRPMQIMYGVDGRSALPEETLDHLEGYRGSRPVRLGNAAYQQRQLDVPGEVLDAAYLYHDYGGRLDEALWEQLCGLADWVCAHWQEPDEGIWEVRGGRRHFVHSKVMCWVALDRALQLAERTGFAAPVDRWQAAKEAIRSAVLARGWNPKRAAFVQHFDTEALDASVLRLPLVGFLPAADPRMRATIDRILQELTADSLVQRYKAEETADGLPGGEGTFSLCTFWLVDCLLQAGRLREARVIFEKMLGYANHLGLYAEEIGPCGEALGNFPQAFTHVGLITSALHLNQALEAGAAWGMP